MTRIIRIADWHHNPKRRKHRFRCQVCARLIADGSDVVLETGRIGRIGHARSHGYHADCFDNSTWYREAVEGRAAQ